MTAPVLVRSACAALFASALCLAVLPGCSNSSPTKAEKNDPKGDQKPGEQKPGDPKPGDPKPGDPKPGDPPTLLKKIEPAAEQVVDAFIKDFLAGNAKADSLSMNFLKMVGKPVILESDKAKGYSADKAVSWLRSVSMGRFFSLSLDRQQGGDAVYCRGALQGHPGNYSIRLVKEAGTWKVDLLVLSSAVWQGKTTPGSADDAFQEFAVTAFIEAMADSNAMPNDDRPASIAATMTPALRAAWGPPFEDDKRGGRDYSPAHLNVRANKLGGGTNTFTVTRLTKGPSQTPEYTVVLTRPAGNKTLSVKLVKGTNPGEWLVNEVSEKG
ncbi:MAG: hypothetical protein L0241_18975 [Planctomycetia bacterium]|nr:hypothetical protein [Planctomycetia bacterium]